jgi:catechol 2,3-dioxygenase-like lactoylglutathione lyase family enzyme
MAVQGLSHVAIGVRDMDASLAFYRDIVGLDVALDIVENGAEVAAFHRRAVYLRWGNDGPAASFIVLDQNLDGPAPGKPAELFQHGVHHYAFWVDDLEAILDRAKVNGVKSLGGPFMVPGKPYGYSDADDVKPMVKTGLIYDPDGNVVQLDQWIDG